MRPLGRMRLKGEGPVSSAGEADLRPYDSSRRDVGSVGAPWCPMPVMTSSASKHMPGAER